MPTKKQTFHEGEIRYLLSRAIRYGINIGKALDKKNIFIQQEIDAYLNEVVPSFMSKAKPTAGSDKPYTKIKKTSKSQDDYEKNQLRLYTNMYGK